MEYVVPIVYSREICDKEYLSKHIYQEENSSCQMIERSGEQDKPLFTFYEETIFDAGRIIYFDDIGKSR